MRKIIRLRYKSGKAYAKGRVKRKVTMVYETDENGIVRPESCIVEKVFYTSASWAGRFGKSRFIKEIGDWEEYLTSKEIIDYPFEEL